jgi:hypothetical protein
MASHLLVIEDPNGSITSRSNPHACIDLGMAYAGTSRASVVTNFMETSVMDTMTHMARGIGPQGEHEEGFLARSIEEYTAELPSDVFLWAACGSIVGSLVLKLSGRNHDALFVGQWAPTFLILGLYNKLVKVAGHDKNHQH